MGPLTDAEIFRFAKNALDSIGPGGGPLGACRG